MFLYIAHLDSLLICTSTQLESEWDILVCSQTFSVTGYFLSWQTLCLVNIWSFQTLHLQFPVQTLCSTTVNSSVLHWTSCVKLLTCSLRVKHFCRYDAADGFACVNEEQPGGRRCQDYKVRFTCPLTFCTEWITSYLYTFSGFTAKMRCSDHSYINCIDHL